MAASEALSGVDLGKADIADAMLLSTEAGWNQTEADWEHFIARGRVHGLRNGDGRLVASAAELPFDGPFGFISMVLVTADHRRRGLATALVDRCIAGLRADGRTPVLDATAAGAEVYRRQGFLPQFTFDRWEGAAAGAEAGARHPLSPEALAGMIALDADVAGAGRGPLLADFAARADTRAVVSGAEGYGLVRRGRRAWQAGPVLAGSEAGALDVIRRLLDHVGGTLFIDVLSAWKNVAAFLSARGFSVQRSFTRMAHQRAQPFGDPRRLFAVAGPEFG
jgi:GNAT superfamily N-acetyltransferase